MEERFEDYFELVEENGGVQMYQGSPRPFVALTLYVVDGFVRSFAGLVSLDGNFYVDANNVCPANEFEVEKCLLELEGSPLYTTQGGIMKGTEIWRDHCPKCGRLVTDLEPKCDTGWDEDDPDIYYECPCGQSFFEHGFAGTPRQVEDADNSRKES